MNPTSSKAVSWSVALGFSLIFSSHAALPWTVYRFPLDPVKELVWLTDVAFGNGMFVAIERGGQTYSAPANDPLTWTARESIPDVDLNRIIFANGIFAAVGRDTMTSSGVFLSSTDGTNWQRSGFENPDLLVDVAYGNGWWVVIGGDRVGRSTNGVDWIMETNFVREPEVHFQTLSFVNGEFMATFWDEWNPDEHIFAPTQLAISTDGTSWVEQFASSQGFRAIAYGRKMYVSLGDTDCIPCGWGNYSSDGRTWETTPFPGNVNGLAIQYANGVFAVAGWGSPSAFLSSTNGVTWEEFQLQADHFFSGLAFGGGRFVAVGHRVFAVSDQVGPAPAIFNARLTPDAIEFEVDAEEKTEWLIEASHDFASWTTLGETEGTTAGPQVISISRQDQPIRYFRLKEKK